MDKACNTKGAITERLCTACLLYYSAEYPEGIIPLCYPSLRPWQLSISLEGEECIQFSCQALGLLLTLSQDAE